MAEGNGRGNGKRFSISAAKMVGDDGVVYALDIHPLAIRAVEKEIKKFRGLLSAGDGNKFRQNVLDSVDNELDGDGHHDKPHDLCDHFTTAFLESFVNGI